MSLNAQKDFQEQARKYFEKAFEDFAQLGHLKGMYLAKKHLQTVLSVQEGLALKLDDQVKETRQKYRDYVYEYGLNQSCSLQREQGDEISLLTELVIYRNNKNLYPVRDQRSKVQSLLPARRASQKNKPSQQAKWVF